MKQAIISGILFSSIWLVGCNGEQKEEQVQAEMIEEIESEQEVVAVPKNEEIDGISNLLSELSNEIIVSITEQTAIEADSIAISLGGSVKEISVSVGFPKGVKVDDTMIRQIVEDSIKRVSETENVAISEENITIKIEKY
ncbi:topoisomerase [Sporosarcina sp. ANT_H38]|uniref:topoisomerase n=1 Tax=Sporosarcina sp. ANT_H38 TaxID=2597358 RepID=UPI0011F16AA6|nr:topoisomerase [Sporosarcina sp. ANT_H38]KAA0955957.1 topoisomerase [Sporosarcina sp. ANT_H38]